MGNGGNSLYEDLCGLSLWGGALESGEGSDDIEGYALSSEDENRVYGIAIADYYSAVSVLDTCAQNDDVKGVCATTSRTVYGLGIYLDATAKLITGSGKDKVTGEATGQCFGYSGSELIAGFFINQNSLINTGSGNDTISGYGNNLGQEGRVSGIFLAPNARIETEDGNDYVSGRALRQGVMANGLDGGGLIDLGDGNDTLDGFGFIRAQGGAGRDCWDLSGYSSTDFLIVKSNQATTQAATFSLGGVTATVEGFEKFVFDNGTFSYASLG